MKVLIIGGNRFVGLRLSVALDAREDVELHVLNRTGQVAHTANAVVHKGNRSSLESAHLDRDWDVVLDFAGFNAADARNAVEFFSQVGRYIFISTASVYDGGIDLKEEYFAPATWDIQDSPTEEQKSSYQFGKRQAEAVFAQEAKFPVTMIRFPFILGPDDYTRRLEFHIERMAKGQPIYMPNAEAHIGMIHAEDAAEFLLRSLTQTFTGPINVASPDPLQVKTLLKMIEKVVRKAPILLKTDSDVSRSPYGVAEDMSLNVNRLHSLGFKTRAIKDWLPELIALQAGDTSKPNSTKLH